MEERSLQITVTGRHVDVSDDVREHAHAKASKLPRFYDRIREVNVILDHESEQFTAEMIVRTHNRHTFVASESGPDTFVLIDVVTERIERQLTRYKERTRDHKHDSRVDIPPEE